MKQCVHDEVFGLCRAARACGEEVIGTSLDAMFAGSGIVSGVVFVADAGAFRRFDVAERHGIVYYS